MAQPKTDETQPMPESRRGPDPDAPERVRGWRDGDDAAESANPGREFGAGGQVDDGPDETAGAGTGGG
jgi:hypothetical protein